MVPIGWLYITYHLLGEPETTIDEMSLKSKYYRKKVRVLSTIILFSIPSGLMFNPSAKTMKPIKRVLFSSWKLKRSLSKLRPKTVAPGMALAPGGKSQKNNKAQWVLRLFLDVPLLLYCITCPIQSPTTEFWMALTIIFHRPKKQWFATSENESFTNQRLLGPNRLYKKKDPTYAPHSKLRSFLSN